MHLYYCAGINSHFADVFCGSGHTHCGSGRECNTHVAGAGGNGQKFSRSRQERDEENSPAQGSSPRWVLYGLDFFRLGLEDFRGQVDTLSSQSSGHS